MKTMQTIKNKINKLSWKGNFFRKSFILILLIASIPGLITGIGIYWFAVGNVEKELMALHDNQIERRANNINEQFKYLEYSTSRWAFDPRFGTDLSKVDFVTEFRETYDITNLLLLFEGSHSLIKDVELYVNAEDPILFNTEYNVLKEDTQAIYEEWISTGNNTNIHWEHYSIKEGKDSSTLALVHNIPAASQNPFGAMIVTIDKGKMLELLKTLTPYDEGATFILDENNEIMLSSNSKNDPSFIKALKAEMLNLNKSKGSYQFDYKGNMYSVSFGQFTRIDSKWTYLSAAPMSSITAPLVFVSRLILIISSSALILAFCMSWFASYRIYTPIKNLVNKFIEEDLSKQTKIKDEFSLIEERWTQMSQKSHLLQSQLSEHLLEIRSSFIVQLNQGFLYHHSEEDLRKRMESYGWNLTNQSFVALDIQMTGMYSENFGFSNNDESLVSFVANNIIEEIGDEFFEQFTVIKFPDLSVGILVLYPKNDKIDEKLHEFANKITKTINQILKMQVTITISESTENVKRISYIFEQVITGKRFRTFENSNQIIDLKSKEHTKKINELHYPFSIEKEVIQAIRMGQVEEVTELVSVFLQELTEDGVNEVNIKHGVVQLYSSIQHEILHSGIHPHDLFEGKNMIDELSQIRDIERIKNWFTDAVIYPYIEKLEGRLNIELKRIIEKVVENIQQNYMEDISLEQCADEAGTNPYTLSKAFKQIVGINFIDYLTELRIDKAKELLLQTDLKINDVAEQVGYRHSYFNRIFKKQMGVPPSQYRKLNQGNIQA
ncbi:helix-turn-helix domain-containing protein [Litchfieldia alkalitelluris]|uniref:helix-turn-helix domain-containing protein n=1 Tax=Litchfieldia alkalitelluris TaxID=304268 RepID=UPI000996CCBA|nr:helix-turn-helix domain-containing protein [Litchfieldia alkalitelluris]